MAALIEAATDDGFPAEIVGVISDRAEARGLERARALGIPIQGDHPGGARRQAGARFLRWTRPWAIWAPTMSASPATCGSCRRPSSKNGPAD